MHFLSLAQFCVVVGVQIFKRHVFSKGDSLVEYKVFRALAFFNQHPDP